MARWTEPLLCAIELSLAACYLLSPQLFLLPALVCVAAVHLLYRRSKGKTDRNWASGFAQAFHKRYVDTGALVHSLEHTNSRMPNRAFGELPIRYRLGDEFESLGRNSRDMTHELSRLFAFGISTGQSIAAPLEEFQNRLSHEAKLQRAITVKTDGMRSITYVGLVLFLPLFGAVSSSIMATLSGSYASSASFSPAQLVYAVLCYIFMALLITSCAYGSEEGLGAKLSGVLPLFTIAFSLTFLTSTYITALI